MLCLTLWSWMSSVSFVSAYLVETGNRIGPISWYWYLSDRVNSISHGYLEVAIHTGQELCPPSISYGYDHQSAEKIR
jgi:hypothetical protein